MEVESIFIDQIKSIQFKEKKLSNHSEKILKVEAIKTILNEERVLRIQWHLYVPWVGNLI